MIRFIIKRLLQAIPVLLGVTFVTYMLLSAGMADPARLALGIRSDIATVEALREEWGLNDPWIVQYGRFLYRALHGDFGRSLATGEDVLESILARFPATAKLGLVALVFAFVFGVPIGVISALKPNGALDNFIMSMALLGISVPSFFLALILAWIFGYILGWTPISGYTVGPGAWKYYILPAISLGTGPMAVIARLTRSSMLEVLTQDYIRTARAKGLPEWLVIFKHALRNALIPVITTLGSSLAGLLSGAFFVEYVFNWPGIGLLAVDALTQWDYPIILGTVMLASILFVLANILVDVLYAVVDPRIRHR